MSETSDESLPEAVPESTSTPTGTRSRIETVLSIIERNHAFILALVIIIPFIYMTTSVIEARNTEAFKDLSAVWGIWVGAVIGYFFGSKQVESLIRRVDTLSGFLDRQSRQLQQRTEENEETVRALQASVDDYERRLDDLEQDYEFAIEDIQFLIDKYGSQMDSVFLERLKKDYGLNN